MRARATVAASVLGAASLAALAAAAEADDATRDRRAVQQGVAIELVLRAGPEVQGETSGPPPLERQQVTIGFRLTDAATGAPLGGLKPAAWIHPRAPGAGARQCREVVQALASGTMTVRPAVDLNVFHVVALNEEPSLSVLDPLLGFGGSKLVAVVTLRSPGHDWAMTGDGRRLFVAMPAAGQVAAIDTVTWKVVATIDAGPRPERVALQADGRYLWVAGDPGDDPAASGVVAIDAARLRVAARLRAGAGPHRLALASDDRTLYVTSGRDGTLSLIDTGGLAVARTLPAGVRPGPVAFSPAAQAAYVVDEATGAILVVDGRSHAVRARIEGGRGLANLRFAPGGRLGFALRSDRDVVQVLDTALNRFVHEVDVGREPERISFSDAFAYVRSRGTEMVTMIPLAGLDRGGPVSTAMVPGGQRPPGVAASLSAADGIVPAPEPGAVLIANAADQTIYYYKEGMSAPTGSFRNYQRRPRAVMVVDRSLAERDGGLYTTTAQLPPAGEYLVPFLLDAPRAVHCFTLTVRADPSTAAARRPSLRVEPLLAGGTVPAARPARIRFKVSDLALGGPRTDLRELTVLAVLPEGWQRRVTAKPHGEGTYEAELTLPRPGVYFVYFAVPSLRLGFTQIPHVLLRAAGVGDPSGQGGGAR